MLHIAIAFGALVLGSIGGYALRGSIRKDIALVASDAGKIAQRLEDAVRTDAERLRAEAVKLIDELRAKL